MAIVMLMAAKTDVMAQFVVTIRLRILGWLATAVMALAVLAMASRPCYKPRGSVSFVNELSPITWAYET
jgi:hypothetical protein